MLGSNLLIASAVAWIASLLMMDGMVTGLWGFILFWTVMMAAMMLPAVMPTVWLYATVAQTRRQIGYDPAPTPMFVTGYLGAWMVVGIGVAFMHAVADMAMGNWPLPIAGGALIITGACSPILHLTPCSPV